MIEPTRTNGKIDRPAILVVMPYGMCFRNIVANGALWSHLRERFTIDVLTGLTVDERTRQFLGIRAVLSTAPRGTVPRVGRLLNRAVFHWLKLLPLSEFFVGSDLGGTYAGICRVVSARWRLFAAAALWELRSRFPWNLLVKALDRFPVMHPAKRLLRRGKYRLVILGHTNETECVIVGRYASRIGIPTVCPVMGVDNLMHGLLQFSPTLLLLWGQEQEDEFVRFHVPRRPELARTSRAVIGSLVYDRYVTATDDSTFRRAYRIDSDEEILLFAAYPDAALSGQRNLCRILVEFIHRHHLRVKLLIRLRPGSVLEPWVRFAENHGNIVRLQTPESVAYGKSDETGAFSYEAMGRDIDTFAHTIRNSTLLVLPSLSTMYQDALALGAASVVALFNYETDRKGVPHRDFCTYQDYVRINPSFATMNVVTSARDLEAFLMRIFVAGQRDGLMTPELFRLQTAASNDGEVGNRAIAAIEGLLHQTRGVSDGLVRGRALART